MDFEKEFPLRLLLNLGRREDRRLAVEERLATQAITVQRFPAIDQRWIKDSRGYESRGRYALALTQRLALRYARQLNAEAVLLLEDDVVLHPSFAEAVSRLELPDDWGIFYFGGAHTSRPEPVGRGIVRCAFTLDTHAIAIRRPYYDALIRALKGIPRADAGQLPASDWRIALRQAEIPSYAAYPNLAWQAPAESDLLGRYYSNYTDSGDQRHSPHAVRGLAAECLGGRAIAKEPPGKDDLPETPQPGFHPAFLFLTLDDWNQPEIWREYLPADQDSYGLYCHPKYPEKVTDPLLRRAIIHEQHKTGWGDISLVRATLALLKAALKEARHSHFILLSESCVPIKPLAHLRRLLQVDRRSLGWHCAFDGLKIAHPDKAKRLAGIASVPKDCAIFHSQWFTLTREAAELLVEDDFTDEFAGTFAPDECYFMTALAMKGYPVDERVHCMDSTWNRWAEVSAHPESFERIDAGFAAELFASPSPFARKFTRTSDIRRHGLHVPYR